ncbi:MAG: hypothetical protein IAE97_06580 [Chthoniobacterales bacterium]|nr:hypothetical protein [Chthoniobacterales bacterium]
MATRRTFALRMGRQLAWSGGVVVVTLAVGVAGYMTIGQLGFIDSFLEASMLLSGAGPLYTERDSANALKIFASLYALFGTLVVVTIVALMTAPVVHRVMHRLHLGQDDR